MSTKRDGINQVLIEDMLRDSAENFFGRRVHLEQEITLLKEKIEHLSSLIQRIKKYQAILAALLVTQDNWQQLFKQILKIELDYPENKLNKVSSCPWSLFFKTKYKKCFWLYYQSLADSVEVYLFGQEEIEPKTKIKKVSFHYELALKWIERLNKEISQLNAYYKPSDFLQFSKRMQSLEGQDNLGGGMVYTLDKDFKYQKLDPKELGLVYYPRLPVGEAVRKKINLFLDGVYVKHELAIKALLGSA